MFEEMTYENILNSMLGRVTNSVDKREGGIIYDALAPAAYKLAETYFNLSNYADLFYVDTSAGEYLDKKASDYGITRKSATYATRKVVSSGAIDIGSRWGKNGTTYYVEELITDNVYSAICEQLGEVGNLYSGKLDSISNTSNAIVSLTDIIDRGLDEEMDNNLKERIKQYLTNPEQDGNAAQYLKWATKYIGIGIAKVFPLWNGGNTVKIAITNGSFLPAESSLVEEFQKYIDPGSTGLGNGVAPIGSKVTVTGGTKKEINIVANVVLGEGYSNPDGAANAISDYLAGITFIKNGVSYMRIGSVLLDCISISEISGLSLNGSVGDVALTGDQIPVLNSLSLTVVTV